MWQVTWNCDDDSFNPELYNNILTEVQVPNLDVKEWKVSPAKMEA